MRGTWADEHVFALRQALHSWDHYQQQIADCDGQIAAVLPPLDPTQPPLVKTAKRAGVNAPEIAKLREILAQMCGGRDLTRLPAHTHYGVLQLIGEVGTDLSAWPSEKHFTAWAGVIPTIGTATGGCADVRFWTKVITDSVAAPTAMPNAGRE